jgi:polar amino acid transport system permease protein
VNSPPVSCSGEPGRTGALRIEGADFPWWLAVTATGAVVVAAIIAASGTYQQVFAIVTKGIGVTVFVSLVAYALACAIGLLVALMEIIRGIPIMVLLFWIAFAGVPVLVIALNWVAAPLRGAGLVDDLMVRDVSLLSRAVLALTIGYSAFIAEIFRAGIQSVDPGQTDAARSLGLTRLQCFRLVIFPQAIRIILPPLGNDFVAMVKDSSLVSVLGVADITQMGKLYAAGTFRFFETYSIVAYVYLLLTLGLSLALRGLEHRLRKKGRR